MSRRLFAKRQFNVIDNHWTLGDFVLLSLVLLVVGGLSAALGYWWLGPDNWLVGTILVGAATVLLGIVVRKADAGDAATGAAIAVWTHDD